MQQTRSKLVKASCRILVILEAALLLSWLVVFTFGSSISSSAGLGRMQPMIGLSIVLVTLVLLLVSPFYIKSLRYVALAGWILAFMSFFLCLTNSR
jgi:hypothetical protein